MFSCRPIYIRNSSAVEESSSEPMCNKARHLIVALFTKPQSHYSQIFAANLAPPCRTLDPATKIENRYFQFMSNKTHKEWHNLFRVIFTENGINEGGTNGAKFEKSD